MKHKSLVHIIIPVILFTTFSVCKAVIRHVPSEYATIQVAIDASTHGDVVELAAGTYWEDVDYLAKAITLRAASDAYCEIRPIGYNCIDITDVNVGIAVLERINLQNISYEYAGGGIVNLENSHVRIIDCDISNNSSSGFLGNGQIIHVSDSDVIFRGCTISHNWTQGSELFVSPGIGIWGSNVVMLECTLTNNRTVNVIQCRKSSLTIDGCTIMDNNSMKSGGAINISQSLLKLIRSTISGNRASGQGGGIYMESMYETVIGGAPEQGNVFFDNSSNCGHDMFYYPIDNHVVDARYNEFSMFLNEGLVRPRQHFNLEGCQYPGTGVVQDVFVATVGSDDNDGLSPGKPFRTIHHAIEVLEPSQDQLLTVHIAPGIYSRDATGEVFPLDVYNNIILQGAGRDATILQGQSQTTLLKFMATAGNGVSDIKVIGGYAGYDGEGGGVFVGYNASPVIANCWITGNNATAGGGAYVYYSSPCFMNCEFSDNHAEGGGAIYSNHSSFVVLDCSIKNNSADSAGGGVYCYSGDNRFYRCLISGNTSRRGGGVRMHDTDSTRLVSCMIRDNTAEQYGGGVASHESCPVIVNCIITDNESLAESGGIDCRYDALGQEMTPRIIHCTVTGNTAVQGAGMSFLSRSDVVMEGSVVYGNLPDSIFVDEAKPVVTYSDIEGGYSGEGNIDGDPLFVEGPEGMYRLSHLAAGDIAVSPCVDAGGTDAGETVFRLFGNLVNMAQLSTRSDNVVDTTTVDMGYHGQTEDFQLLPAVEIIMDNYFSPGFEFEVIGRIYNTRTVMKDVPVVFMFSLEDQYYMWPGWSSS
ncbi:right-handed parallel beta-helix repeat-containing protein, partial [bacterium]|nr:right-handed parallel beta-helix repeat-containing protein [bacterium]